MITMENSLEGKKIVYFLTLGEYGIQQGTVENKATWCFFKAQQWLSLLQLRKCMCVCLLARDLLYIYMDGWFDGWINR